MLVNYIKVAWRNLSKRKGFTFINILGLATGMAVCLLIVLYIQSELSYDAHHERGDQIYRIVLDRKYPGRINSYSIIPQSIAGAVKAEMPEVKESTRIFNFNGNNAGFFLKIADKVFEEKRVLAADSNFFRVFSGDFITGDPANALEKPNTVVVNESTAIKYFGSASAALNKTFETEGDNNNIFQITGVVKDWPENSHFHFDLLLSTTGFAFTRQPNYVNFSAHTYILLHENSKPSAVESRFPVIIRKYVAGDVQRLFGVSIEQFQKDGNGYRYYLQPLKKIHLISNLESELSTNGSQTAVYIFSVIAVFILFLACINFINLSTARSVERARETGIRKTFGSDKQSLIFQFLTESIVLSLFSIVIAMMLIAALIPLFNQLSGKSLTIWYFLEPLRAFLLLLFAVATGLIAGLYPAVILSSFKPIEVLKGKFHTQTRGLLLRNGLVIFQFAISVGLIIATIVVNRQMNYVMGDRLGFRKDHIITIQRTDLLNEQYNAFKNELLGISGVEVVSGTTAMPGESNYFGISYQMAESREQLTGRGIITDESYSELLGLELKEGRFFSRSYGTDTLALVLNEKAVADLGLQNPVGARLSSPDGFLNAPDGSTHVYTVIGVVRDFHFQSLHQKINPLFFNYAPKFGPVTPILGIRIKAAGFKEAIARIETSWKKFVKDRPINYQFLDQTLARQYHAEQTMQKIFTIFSALAIFIACIGLLGLAAYTTQLRTREISIRKVLGANTGQIVSMLSTQFLRLVLLAALFAFPLSWWAMHSWLENFAYRTSISIWIFIIASVAALGIAVFTISFQAIKASLMNPVQALRNE